MGAAIMRTEEFIFVMLVVSLFLFVENVIAFQYGTQTIYDNFNDNAINYSKWQNYSSYPDCNSAGFQCTRGENSLGYTLSMLDPASTTGLYTLFQGTTSINISQGYLKLNISQISGSKAGSSTVKCYGATINLGVVVTDYVNGDNCAGTTTYSDMATGIWELNRTSASTYSVTFNGAQLRNITTTDSNLIVTAFIKKDSGATATILSNVTFEDVYLAAQSIDVDLISPINNGATFSNPVSFNASVLIANATIQNLTYIIYRQNGTLFNRTTVLLSNISDTSYVLNVSNFSAGGYLWNARACTTSNLCDMPTSNFTFVWGYNVNNVTYTNPIFETQNDTFRLNITYDASVIPLSTATLYYNGTAYASTGSSNGNTAIFTNNLTMPGVSSPTVFNFFWQIALNDGFGVQYFNTSTYNQTVLPASPINAGTSCTSGTPAYNFTFADEDSRVAGRGNITYNLQYGFSGNLTGKLVSGNLTNISSFVICVNATQTPYLVGYGELQYIMDGGRVPRRYYLFNNSRLANITVNVTLYDLLNTVAVPFQFTAQDVQLNPYEGYYAALLRWYPELNAYYIVDMGKTDNKGQTVMNAEVENIDYRVALYSSDGTLINFDSAVRFVCSAAPCSYSIFVGTDNEFTSFFNIQTSLTYSNNTQDVIYIWNDPSQVSQTMNLTVFKIMGNQTITICSSSAIGYIGVLACDVSSYTGLLRAQASRIVNDIRTPIASLFIDRGTSSILSASRGFGALIGLIIIGLSGLIGAYAGIIPLLVLTVFGVGITSFFGVVNFAVVMIVIGIAFIIYHVAKKT